jgi:hypothetical protein
MAPPLELSRDSRLLSIIVLAGADPYLWIDSFGTTAVALVMIAAVELSLFKDLLSNYIIL